MSVLAILAAAGAVVALWAGATRYTGTVARGYRWLGGAALFWFAGLIITQVLAGQISSTGLPLSVADVAPLLALASAATGVMVLADGVRKSDSGSVLPGLADGYVMAVALLVIGWVLAFGAEFQHLGERPQTFLGYLLLPLADLAVLGALLPVLTAAWRRVLVPYLALLVLAGADSLGVGARINGGHQGIIEQLGMIVAACLFGLAPWVETIAARFDLVPTRISGAARDADGSLPGLLGVRRSPVTSAGAATIIAAVAVVIATLMVIVNGLASAPASGLALVIAGGAAVLVVGVRILMLVRENGVAVRMWREASNSLRDLADRTGDMVLICDLDGTISYASPLVSAFSYAPEALVGKPLSEFVHPEDIGAAREVVAAVVGVPAEEALMAAPADGAPQPGVAARSAGEPAPRRGRRRRALQLPGAGRGRDLAARRVRRPALPAARRARPAAGQRQGRLRPGRAPSAGDASHLPRWADRAAEPRLRGGARPGGARPIGRAQGRRHLPRPRRFHRGQRPGRPRCGRPGAGPGGAAAARGRAGPGDGRPLGRR